MTWTRGSIVNSETVNHTEDGDIHITGKIDNTSHATLVSTNGSIIIDGKIDGTSTAVLTAAQVIRIGAAETDDGEKKIDNNSTVTAHAGFDISVGHKIDDNSVVTLTSDLGSITIGGKIDHNSNVTLTAAGNIRIGEAGNDGAERKIDGNSHVNARAGGTIHLYNKIDGGSVSGDHSVVDFRACRGISIDDKIDGGSRVRLAIKTGTINIGDKVGGGGTQVLFWPPGSLHVENGIDSNGSATASNWSDPTEWCKAGPSGFYWRNWMQSFGYVTTGRVYPRTVKDISDAIKRAEKLPVKAVGGGWSATDASLPFRTQAEIDRISILRRGAGGQEDFSHVLQGLNNVTNSPVDLQPEAVAGDLDVSTHYDQQTLRELVDSGANLPFASEVMLIDTRGLASSLQAQLPSILSDAARAATAPGSGGAPPAHHYFHVEAGITMADFDQLLDHQSPRLAVMASGGSVGATLAGALSTATHGAEFKDSLLVDCVRAIHLVGPDGAEWWIEGGTAITDYTRLQQVYSGIDHDHFIAGAWTQDTLTAQDVLNAVIVSMGTMGVIYSMVLEVRLQFGIQQIVTALPGDGTDTGWGRLLEKAGVTVQQLRDGDADANKKVLDVLLNKNRTDDPATPDNGTGIPFAKNVFCDLAINPINLDCWIVNRRETAQLPVDSNSPPAGFGTIWTGLDRTLGNPAHAPNTVENSRLVGRIFDFLNWATAVPSVNVSDTVNDVQQASRLASFVTSYPDVMVAALATLSVQAVANTANESNVPARGLQFVGDMLTGMLNAFQGTVDGKNGDTTETSYKVWAVGWPSNGVPGRGLEIALPQEKAFSFLQTVLLDDVLKTTMVDGNKPLFGYISVRICPPTKTLMGMQQFAPFSVMIEVVGYRSPEANTVMDRIQEKALDRSQRKLDRMLHWGLENDQLTAADLARMPVNQPLRSGSAHTKLSAFKKIRQILANGHSPSPFDNHFVARLNL
jgi:FAD/FMN-containing dehydrogenase